jgi:hypothetical protein
VLSPSNKPQGEQYHHRCKIFATETILFSPILALSSLYKFSTCAFWVSYEPIDIFIKIRMKTFFKYLVHQNMTTIYFINCLFPQCRLKCYNFHTPRADSFNCNSIGCSIKFILKVGVEESIVNAPPITNYGSAV